jgi:hypothetical protein
MKEQTEYEINKQKRKQKLVRNDFLYFNNSTGKYDFPIIKKQNIDINKINFLSYVNTKKDDKDNKDKTIHFFTYDWLFEKVYEKPDEELEKLSQYYALLSPDFSIFTNMPIALQIESIFKNRWCGAYFQSKGLKVIPTVSWGDEKSFEFCFDGIEQGSVVAVCTYYRENCEEEFILGYNKMLERIKPSMVLCYDEPFKSMKGNIKEFLPTTYEWTKNLDWKELVQFKWEKQNKNISGLNEKNFKYFNYDDPYEKNELVKCTICGKVATQDQYGNGECSNCGWKFSKDEEKFEKSLGISYPMLVPPTRAREQYKKGLPFKATFEDFIKGLFFYSEMIFTHNGINYEVFFKKDYTIVLCSNKTQQEYKTKEDFFNNANIDGKLLKDIWNEVENAGFMFCE